MFKYFADIYDEEKERYRGVMDQIILDSLFVRNFVYEVCKRCIEAEQNIPHNQQINSDRVETKPNYLFSSNPEPNEPM